MAPDTPKTPAERIVEFRASAEYIGPGITFVEWLCSQLAAAEQQLEIARADLADEREMVAMVRQELDEALKELARWQICENCGTPLTGPGICDRAISEHEKGLELMHEETLTRAEAAEAQLAARDAEILKLREALERIAAKPSSRLIVVNGVIETEQPPPHKIAREALASPLPVDQEPPK